MAISSDLLALTKPRLSVLVIITAGGGFWLSHGESGFWLTVFAVGGTTLVVAAANTLNNYLERDSDKYMARTRNRPLPSQRMAPTTALVFGLFLTAIAIPGLTLLTTPMAGVLAAIALITYVLVYTPLKRISSMNTLVGAIPGGMPPLIGWAAATGRIELGGVLLFFLMFLWQIPHSLAITIYRQAEYEQAGLVVLPSTQGLEATRRQILLYTFVLFPVPLFLFHAGVCGWLTLVVGTMVGAWWLASACRGFLDRGTASWARKFFFQSLIYLSVCFASLTLDAFWLGV